MNLLQNPSIEPPKCVYCIYFYEDTYCYVSLTRCSHWNRWLIPCLKRDITWYETHSVYMYDGYVSMLTHIVHVYADITWVMYLPMAVLWSHQSDEHWNAFNPFTCFPVNILMTRLDIQSQRYVFITVFRASVCNTNTIVMENIVL
jgi:hypothetical protein